MLFSLNFSYYRMCYPKVSRCCSRNWINSHIKRMLASWTKWVIRDGGLVARLNRLWCEHCCGNETPDPRPSARRYRRLRMLHGRQNPPVFSPANEWWNRNWVICNSLIFNSFQIFLFSLLYFLISLRNRMTIYNETICFAGWLHCDLKREPLARIYTILIVRESWGSGSNYLVYNQRQWTVISLSLSF